MERDFLGSWEGRGLGGKASAAPDRTPAGRSRGAIISQYYNRTVRLRRRVSRPELRGVGRSARPSLRLYDLELDPVALEEEGERSDPCPGDGAPTPPR